MGNDDSQGTTLLIGPLANVNSGVAACHIDRSSIRSREVSHVLGSNVLEYR